ncbi:hypothetical protein A6024_06380 [Rhodovulum sulfidophilum]|nr:hypothetical protein A6W98_06525 [Rhodovulum sulfidophilum DSM 1374]ANB37584.1 hypothetical protein A6024_06380 [Rhodovulum sulfidophilum]
MNCLADRLRVSRIIFLALDEGLHMGGRDEADVVTQRCQLPPPEMHTTPGLHRHQTRRQTGEELEHLSPPELLAQDSIAFAVSTMDLEQVLREVQPDRDNLRHDRLTNRIVATPPRIAVF